MPTRVGTEAGGAPFTVGESGLYKVSHDQMTSELISFLSKYQDSMKKVSGKKVVSNRKTRPVDLVNNLMHKVIVVDDTSNLTVLSKVEEYLIELFEDEE